MRIKNIHVKNYKRFTELTICDLPETARLVVLVGPNGTVRLGPRADPAPGLVDAARRVLVAAVVENPQVARESEKETDVCRTLRFKGVSPPDDQWSRRWADGLHWANHDSVNHDLRSLL